MKKLLVLLAFAAAPASAHIVFAPAQATAGSYYAGAFRVGHGCDGAATTSVRVEIPDGIVVARPQPKPGWTIEVERSPLAAPVTNEGHALHDRVSAVTWRGHLPDDQFDEFGLMLKLPSDRRGALHLPVVQACGDIVVRWDELPAPGDGAPRPTHPAPALLVGGTEASHAH